jgi:hypothetical protein
MDGDGARRLALSFPETVEKETWGHPTFRVREEMAELVEDAWRMTAPKRVVRAFDAA